MIKVELTENEEVGLLEEGLFEEGN